MPIKDPLIRHAITPPTFDSRNSMHRERLVDAIHAGVPGKLIAIAAPPGYGKTTLLADFAAHTDLTICWARLTEADWDVMRFANVLATSLQTRYRRLKGQPDLDALATSSPEALAIAFAEAIDEHVGEALVIALDDVHIINQSEQVLAFLDRLLEDLPEQATILAAGREVLEVSLARLMAERDLVGFGPHDLALTREELAELMRNGRQQEIPDAELDRVLEESRGWITGVVMEGAVSQIGSGTLIGGGRPMVYEYLASVVLNRQPDDLRRFALDASVLPVMTSEACDAVLDRDDSAKYLGRLVSRGLFVTATQTSPRTYEFHPLFREFLHESLEGADPQRLRRLRTRAADYLIAEGLTEQAVDLLIDAGATTRAAKLAEAQAAAMFKQGRILTLERWYERLAGDGATIPTVNVMRAQALVDKGQLEAAEALLDEASAAVQDGAAKSLQAGILNTKGFLSLQRRDYGDVIKNAIAVKELYRSRRDRVLCGNAMRAEALAVARGSGDIESALECIHEAIELLDGSDSEYSHMLALIDRSLLESVAGLAPEAARTTDRVLQVARKIGAPLTLAMALNNRAYIAHQAGDYERSLRLAREGLMYAHRAASPLRQGILLMRQGDVFSDLGLALQAAELYGEALTIFMELDNIQWTTTCCVQTSALHRRQGGARVAHEWLKRALLLHDEGEPPPSVRIQLAALEAVAAPQQSIDTLRPLLNGTGIEKRELVLAQYLKAKAAIELGDEGLAQESMRQALENAAAFGAEQPLASELRFDDVSRAFLNQHFRADAALAIVEDRIARIESLSVRYQDGELEQDDDRLRIAARGMGRSKITLDGEEPDLTPRSTEIVFYLIDGGRVSKDSLMQTFWPDQSVGRQKSSLFTAVSSIRRILGKDTVVLDGDLYRIDPVGPLDYDVESFERAARAALSLPPGDPRLMFALEDAIGLYKGEFLPEYNSDWVLDRREELAFRFIDLLASHSEEALFRDRPEQAVETLTQALRIDPLREATNMQYMVALDRLGRRAEIVSHYQAFVQRYEAELGLPPPDELRELYARLIS